jgi:hypothetical protein
MSDQEIDHVAAHRSMMEQQLISEGNQFAKAFMIPAETNYRKRLRDDYFTRIFWPMFRYLLTGENPEQNVYDMQLGNWITYAGSVNAEVIVTDQFGKELFTVPAVFDNRAVKPAIDGAAYLDGERLPSVKQVMAQFSLYEPVAPAEGVRYLGEELSKRSTIMKGSADLNAWQTAWNKIFEFYGEKPLYGNSAQPQSQAAKGAEPEYEFDAP